MSGIVEDAGLTGILLIDVSIGVIFAMLTFSLLATTLHEAISGVLNLRGEFLRKGVVRLVRDDEIRAKLLEHPLIEGLKSPKNLLQRIAERIAFWRAPEHERMPSNIPKAAFARALVEGLVLRRDELARKLAEEMGGAEPALRAALKVVNGEIDKLALDERRKARLRAVVGKIDLTLADADTVIGDTLDRIEAEIGDWFDEAMDRVTGWYVRRTKTVLFVIGAVAALAVNFDVLGYAARLAHEDELRAAIVARAGAAVETGAVGSLRIDGATLRQTAELEEDGAPTAAAVEAAAALREFDTDANGEIDAAEAAAAEQRLRQAALALRDRTAEAIETLTTELGDQGVALGWEAGFPRGLDLLRSVVSWLLVGLACTLGGQFWFDLLRSVFKVRAGAAGLNSDVERLARSLRGAEPPAGSAQPARAAGRGPMPPQPRPGS